MDWKKVKRDALRSCLGDYDTADLVRLYNEMAEHKNYTMIQENTDDVLDELFSCPSDAIMTVSRSEYNYADDYLYYDVYFESFDHWSDKNSPIDLDELAYWFADHDDRKGIIEPEELIDFFVEEAVKEGEDEESVADWLVGEDLVGEDWEYLFERYLSNKANEWFEGLDILQLEEISNLMLDDYTDPDRMADGQSDFVEAVQDWWDDLDNEKKVEIYRIKEIHEQD